MNTFEILNNSADVVAKRLLGCILERQVGNDIVQARIVETEAYDQTDAASHSYKGRTTRTDVMFGASGHLYVYFTYGMHYCANIVVGSEGYGAAVLIRAVEPIIGEEIMQRGRNKRGIEISNGPAKLCQALGIDKAMNGHDLHQQPFKLIISDQLPSNQITQTTRVGISRAKDVLWRFYITDNPYVSHR